jgi:hypothetical protein
MGDRGAITRCLRARSKGSRALRQQSATRLLDVYGAMIKRESPLRTSVA